MTDILELSRAIGTAYALAHVGADRPSAIAHIREHIAEPTNRAAAVDRAAELAALVHARSSGNDCGCYVTKFSHDLLTEALNDGR